MISSKSFSITTALVLLLLFSAVLANSAKTECPTNASSSKFNEKQEKYVVLLKPTKGSTGAFSASKSSKTVEQHLNFLKECWGIDSESILDDDNFNSASTTKKVAKNKVLSFSVGTLSGYSGLFSEKFVKEQIEPLSDVLSVEKVVRVKIPTIKNTTSSKTVKTKDVIVKATGQNVPPHNLDRIDQRRFPLDGKYRFPSTAGAGVDVYVVGSGINVRHPEFGNRARIGGVFCNGCVLNDVDGTGTAIASIIGGTTFGAAKKVKLVAVKVYQGEFFFTDGLLNGIAFILRDHLTKKNRKSVVNISLSYNGIEEIVDTAIKSLTDAGIHVVVMAGDQSQDGCNFTPSAAQTSISVGSTDFFNDSIASFSNFGRCVDIFAPGVNVVGIANNAPELLSGTSFSAPQVSGAIALSIGRFGNTTPAKMTRRLITASTKNILKGLTADTPNRFLFVPLN